MNMNMNMNSARTRSSNRTAATDRRRMTLLSQMRKQAVRDAVLTVGWLRERVEAYHVLDPASAEAEDLVLLFTNYLIIWGNEARFEVPAGLPCHLSLDLDCEAAEEYSIGELSVVSASVIYRNGIYIQVAAIETELHQLLGAVQRIVNDEEERQLEGVDEEDC